MVLHVALRGLFAERRWSRLLPGVVCIRDADERQSDGGAAPPAAALFTCGRHAARFHLRAAPRYLLTCAGRSRNG